MNQRFINCALASLACSLQTLAATFTVTNTNDSGAGSLRAAITSANGNANNATTLDVINFSVAGTITLLSDLPVISEKVDIQGQTATGASAGTPKITINCNDFKAIDITAGNSIVNTLCIVNGENDPGITLRTGGSNTVKGCYIGMTLTGTGDANKSGINIKSSTNNTIGGTTAAERNIISGNNVSTSSDGIEVESNSTGTTIRGNYIGVKSDGATALGNGNNGISFKTGSGSSTIGGTAAGAGNIIGGNAKRGIDINNCTNITIQGNYIGTNSARADLGNNGANVFINNGSTNIVVGSVGDAPAAGEGNTIAYSKTDDGVHLNDDASDFNPIRGNIMFCNKNESIKLIGNSNGGIASPISSGLPSSTNHIARGTCTAGNSVHVFRNPAPTLSCKCEGEVLIGRTTCAVGGTWTLTHNLNLTNAEIEAVTAVQIDASNNTSTYSSCNATIALPITLLFFKALVSEGSSVLVNWATALESNTESFEIRRSADGLHWESIGNIPAKGGNSHYSFQDVNPLSGSNYYQLLEVEQGGKTTPYAVAVVQMASKGMVFDVYPNPSQGSVFVHLSDDFIKYDLEAVDLNGRLIGSHSLTAGKTEIFISASPGLYFLKLKIKGESKVKKVLVY